MRLVEVPAVRGELHPIETCALVYQLQYALETADAAEQLGRESYVAAEQLNEPARTDADLVRNFRHEGSCMNVGEQGQRALNRAMPLQRPESLIQQTALKHQEFLLGSRSFQHALAEQW